LPLNNAMLLLLMSILDRSSICCCDGATHGNVGMSMCTWERRELEHTHARTHAHTHAHAITTFWRQHMWDPIATRHSTHDEEGGGVEYHPSLQHSKANMPQVRRKARVE
jgi:hypothetical protein